LRSNGLYLELSIFKNNNGRLEGQYYKQLANLGGESGLPPVLIKKIMKTVRTLKHRKTTGRSLTDTRQLPWLQKQRSEEIKSMTIDYNNRFEGRPIFSCSQVLLILYGMSEHQYLTRELTKVEYKQFFFKGGRYKNYVPV